MKARFIPAARRKGIQDNQPFFQFSDEDGYGFQLIAKGLINLSPSDYRRGFSFGETVALACLRIIKNYPPLPGVANELDADVSGLAGFIEGYRIDLAPECFRVGFYSVFEVVANVSLQCPHLFPALDRVILGFNAQGLEDRALTCLLTAPAPASPTVEKWVALAVPCLGDLIEAEYRAMAGDVGGHHAA